MHKATVRQHADNFGNQTDIHMRPSLSSYDNVDVFHLAQTTQTSAVFWNFANFREDCIETLKNNKEEQHWLICWVKTDSICKCDNYFAQGRESVSDTRKHRSHHDRTTRQYAKEQTEMLLISAVLNNKHEMRRLFRNFHKNVGKYGKSDFGLGLAAVWRLRGVTAAAAAAVVVAVVADNSSGNGSGCGGCSGSVGGGGSGCGGGGGGVLSQPLPSSWRRPASGQSSTIVGRSTTRRDDQDLSPSPLRVGAARIQSYNACNSSADHDSDPDLDPDRDRDRHHDPPPDEFSSASGRAGSQLIRLVEQRKTVRKRRRQFGAISAELSEFRVHDHLRIVDRWREFEVRVQRYGQQLTFALLQTVGEQKLFLVDGPQADDQLGTAGQFGHLGWTVAVDQAHGERQSFGSQTGGRVHASDAFRLGQGAEPSLVVGFEEQTAAGFVEAAQKPDALQPELTDHGQDFTGQHGPASSQGFQFAIRVRQVGFAPLSDQTLVDRRVGS
ncbi:hypothetical protein T12_15194 [Trichinella patagoniensis]|uniref:Uncharacterized protein n=1 Tax=Trichinella patagoniensis TaxID=990121 RepID=A0A0V0ZI78_9BILA|nr:hypothetical protein T12_15194 [Trichinella patagoniensis]